MTLLILKSLRQEMADVERSENQALRYQEHISSYNPHDDPLKQRLPLPHHVTASSQMRRAKRYLPMIINGSKYRTVPDTGSLENPISADEVRRLQLTFTGNIRRFVMGNGSTTMSLGSVSLKCAFA